jgi:hypothetical protein
MHAASRFVTMLVSQSEVQPHMGALKYRQRRSCSRAAIVLAAALSGALFALSALAQPVPFLAKGDPGKDTGAAAQAALDPGATRTRIEQEIARLPERLERARCEPVT